MKILLLLLLLFTPFTYAVDDVREKGWIAVQCWQDESIASAVPVTGLGSTTFTQSEEDRSSAIMFQTVGDDFHWTADGSTPTSTLGFTQIAGDPPFFYTGNLKNLLFIEDSTSTDMFVCLFK